MNKKHLLLFLGLIGTLALNAQQHYCGTDENARNIRKQFPEFIKSEQDLQAFTEWFRENKNNFSRNDEEQRYIVPVVFHILHDGGTEYLSDVKIAHQEMQNINEYFSATNPELGGEDYPNVHTAFRDIVADMNIEFRLARKDPQGNCTNGIDRIYTYATRIGNNDSKLNPWPREKYLNIWVCKSVDLDSASSGTIAYSMYPGSVQDQINNNIIDGVQSKHVGVGAASGFMRHVIAHEIGHWLNLMHTWGGTNDPGVACGDDDVDDTPLTKGQMGGCNVNETTCGDISNVQNIMNYADCGIMFTEGQKERSRAALASDVAGRNNLWSPENLEATGVEPLYECLPKPKAEFGYNKRFACVGETIRLVDYTSNRVVGEDPTFTRKWEFPVDVEGFGSEEDSIQNVSFSTPGWKTITLTSSNASGTDVKTKTTIYINAKPAIPYPFYESFDDPVSSADWIPINYDDNNTAFTYRTDVGHHSDGSYGLNYYQTTYRGDRDELVSPPFDLTGISEEDFRFSFEFSFACRFDYEMTTSFYDSIASLETHISKDCGTTWKRVSRIIGNRQLMNGGFINASYTPGKENQYWKKVTVNLAGGQNSQYKTSDVLIKFVVNGAKNGNNFYLDNFNLGNHPSSIDDNEGEEFASIELYPNPTENSATLSLSPVRESNCKVDVLDVLGKKMMTVFEGRIAGQTEVNINTSTLPKGIYLVQVNSNGKTLQQKLVKL